LRKVAVMVLVTALLMMLFAAPVMATPRASSPAWHLYPATDTYTGVAYDDLTDICLAAGLSENPYPAPLTSTATYDPATFVLTVTGESDYYVFTITIGDEVYPGVACNVYEMTLNYLTGIAQIVEQSTHYFGALGKMNHGFKGVVTVDMYGQFDYTTTPPTYIADGFAASWELNMGFGRFTGQSLTLAQDTSKGEVIGTGSCLVLGNKWYK